MRQRLFTNMILIGLLLMAAVPVAAEPRIDGFLQGLFGGRVHNDNPTTGEYTASETRLQLRAEHFADNAEFFGRLDYVYDAAGSDVRSEWELREGYLKFRLGSHFDFKVGRQILTWGTGDLIFINDVFAKDYRSFFVGRDDQYLKAPQNALRVEYYSGLGDLSVVWTPRFEPNRLPTGEKLSYFSPIEGRISGGGQPFVAERPSAQFKNGEVAARLSRTVGGFRTALYAYHGFYKNPVAMRTWMVGSVMHAAPYFPRLNVYGASLRGMKMGGILWLEGGYFDSHEDPNGDDPYIQNSSVTGMIGFERQVATNLTANLQWQVDYMLDHNLFAAQQMPNAFVRDELRHLVTSRWTKLTMDENLTLSAFVFYSPSDEDGYMRLSAGYKYSDEMNITIGGNLFTGEYENTDYGQFQKNDNAYLKMTYGF